MFPLFCSGFDYFYITLCAALESLFSSEAEAADISPMSGLRLFSE
jgi:hypothetical protein